MTKNLEPHCETVKSAKLLEQYLGIIRIGSCMVIQFKHNFTIIGTVLLPEVNIGDPPSLINFLAQTDVINSGRISV